MTSKNNSELRKSTIPVHATVIQSAMPTPIEAGAGIRRATQY